MEREREQFKSRLGFILISAGCAIGLGNIWKFPWMVGEYGGAAFIIIYLVFLILLVMPIMCIEFTVGRGSQRGIAQQFDILEPKGSKWHVFKWFGIAGNYLLMMFYVMVAGWMLNYIFKMATGVFASTNAEHMGEVFGSMVSDPVQMVVWTLIASCLGMLCCAGGVQKGVERVTKVLMVALFILLIILAVRSVTLTGAEAGLAFYLVPDFSKIFCDVNTAFEVMYAAMSQAFFTLSVGIGSMAIFGSYISRDRSLWGETLTVAALDTFVAIVAGLIIFPACFAFGVDPGASVGLVFMTLPAVFEQMFLGQVWGTLFFVLMSAAAMSTVIAVFENLIAFGMDQWAWSRKKSTLINAIAIPILCLPCVFGFNIWSSVGIPEIEAFASIMDFEDFLVSYNLLPIGSLIYVLFCVTRKGWGWKAFMAEVNSGKGIKFPDALRIWMTYIVPVVIVVVLFIGWWVKLFQFLI